MDLRTTLLKEKEEALNQQQQAVKERIELVNKYEDKVRNFPTYFPIKLYNS